MQRYGAVRESVLEVMREKMAELGNRVMRRDLREEARKHIGDTGLLDHLLKHMAGKVVGNRGERFMRGYSNDGVMHYWLEPPAEVEESRRKGEMEVCRCGSECKEEIDMLKERIGVLNSDLEELRSLKELEKNIWKENYEKLLKRNIKLEIEMEKMNSAFLGMKENYERLLKRNTKLETEMVGMSNSFQGLKDELMSLKEERSKEVKEEKAVGFETVEDVIGGNGNGFVVKNEDNYLLENHLSLSPKASLYSPQLRRQYPQLPCRGRVYVNCLNGSQKSFGHLSQVPSPVESDELSSLTNSQCTRQRHELAEV
ncbi:uncharacterized protein A4U43_C06F2570 [Asparagus officinalis]|uniref:PTC1-like winged helix-turn-helix domain-containing protein n=1 Tax=Asparagus officinalis TaxID=4686 RepID=A0A5P1EJ28_ASPOF|nr:protein DYAD-like [Asparagus officinalis]ONK65942.1 uncharacterized protein A4U43_C06F2570 [Asparagus officinalis]